jgi:hypothetical protein
MRVMLVLKLSIIVHKSTSLVSLAWPLPHTKAIWQLLLGLQVFLLALAT